MHVSSLQFTLSPSEAHMTPSGTFSIHLPRLLFYILYISLKLPLVCKLSHIFIATGKASIVINILHVKNAKGCFPALVQTATFNSLWSESLD